MSSGEKAETAGSSKDDGGATSEDSEWRCTDCGRFALKRRLDGTKMVCNMCFAARQGYPPLLSPLKQRLKEHDDTVNESEVDGGTESDAGTALQVKDGETQEENDVEHEEAEKEPEREDLNVGDLEGSDGSVESADRLSEVDVETPETIADSGSPTAHQAAAGGKDGRPLRKRNATMKAEVRHPRLRLVMSGRRKSPVKSAAPTAVAKNDVPRPTTPRLAAKREAALAAEAALALSTQAVVAKKKTADAAAVSSREGDREVLFPPGQCVWTGGRGYQGGLWDPWPGRVVEPSEVNLLRHIKVGTSRRVIMLFGRHPDDRQYVIMSVAALRPYVVDANNINRKFRDPRGRFACCLANICEEDFPPSFTGIIEEDVLKSKLPPEQLALATETVSNPTVGSTEYDLKLPGSSLKEMRLQATASTIRGGSKQERGKRRAAVNNRFCGSPQDKPSTERANSRAVGLPPSAGQQETIVEYPQADEGTLETAAEAKHASSGDDEVTALVTNGERHRQKRNKDALERNVGDWQGLESGQARKRSRRSGPEAGLPAERVTGRLEGDGEIDLSRLGVDEIAYLMTQFVTQGYSAKLRRAAAEYIGNGCASYALNGRALLAKQPSNEALAQAVLRERKEGSQIVEDGCFYSVLDFIRIARLQEQDLSGLRLKTKK